jgi:hypothetical protein
MRTIYLLFKEQLEIFQEPKKENEGVQGREKFIPIANPVLGNRGF